MVDKKKTNKTQKKSKKADKSKLAKKNNVKKADDTKLEEKVGQHYLSLRDMKWKILDVLSQILLK